MRNHATLILGMMAVTYLPRLLPLLMLAQRPLPPRLRRFLLSIPCTALSALIVRGIIQAPPRLLLPTLVGIAVAGVAAWARGGLILAVLASIVASFLVIQGLGS